MLQSSNLSYNLNIDMMVKSKNISIIILAILIMATACSDFLLEEQVESVDVDYIYSSPEGLEAGLVGLYNLQRTAKWNHIGASLFRYTGTDLAVGRTFWTDRVYANNMTALSFPDAPWVDGYQIIDRANALIENAQEIAIDENDRNILIGQVRYIRAQTYFNLIRLYDNIILKSAATVPEHALEEQEHEPANLEDVYALINSDLDFAIANLDWTVEPGRFGQGAARMARAKTAMWQEDWTTAAAQCDAIIESGNYSLVDISKVFQQDINSSNETIYADQYDRVDGGSSSLAGGSGHELPAIFTNRYYEMDTEIVSVDSLGGNTYGWRFPNDYLKSLYDLNDKRLQHYYWPQTYDKSYIINNPDSPNFGEPLPEEKYPDNYRQYHWSLKKYFDRDKPTGSGFSWKDVIVYRLAETYLLGAEAHWRMTSNSTDPTALEYIGKIRERAGLPNVSSIDQQTILDERARELAFEGKRWYTLKRMGVLVEQVNQHYMYGSNSQNVENRQMEPHMVRLPIPQSQIDLMGDYPQNEGY